MMAATLDFNEGQGAEEGCVVCCVFLVAQFLARHGFLGAADRFLGGGFIDLAFLHGHVGENGNLFGSDFDESFADGQAEFCPLYTTDAADE